jgi:hypothetical protein
LVSASPRSPFAAASRAANPSEAHREAAMPSAAAVTYKKPNVYIDDPDKLLFASDDPFRQL